MIKNIFIVVVTFILFSCENGDKTISRSDGAVKTINVDMSSVQYNADVISMIDTSWYKIVPLETTEHSLVGGKIKNIYYRNNRLYICEMQTESVLIFDDSGKFISKIQARGEGPGEYLRISSVRINDKGIYIYDDMGLKVLHFDLDGNYVDRYSLRDCFKKALVPHYVFYVGDRIYVADQLLTDAKPKYGAPHKVCAIDMVGDSAVYTKYLPYDLSTAPTYQFYLRDQKYAINKDGEVLFMCDRTDTIYVATKDEVRPAYVLDFGKYNLPESMKGEESIRKIRENPDYGKYIWEITHLMDTDKYLIVKFHYESDEVKKRRDDGKSVSDVSFEEQVKNSLSFVHWVVYEKETGETMLINDMMLPVFEGYKKFYPRDADGEYLIDWVSVFVPMIGKDCKMMHVSIPDNPRYERELNEVYSSITPNSNPVVFIYKMK